MLKRAWGWLVYSWVRPAVLIPGFITCFWVGLIAGGFHPYDCPDHQDSEHEACSESFTARATFPIYAFNEFGEAHEGAFVGLGTLALVGATLLLWLSTEKLWRDAKIQGVYNAKAAEAAFAQTRPWIWLDGDVVSIITTLNQTQETTIHIEIKFTAKNIGATPAINADLHVRALPFRSSDDYRKLQAEFADRALGFHDKGSASAIFPAKGTDRAKVFNDTIGILPSQHGGVAINRDTVYVVFGVLIYDAGGGQLRETGFIWGCNGNQLWEWPEAGRIT